ncbi:RNase adapter RapZ [Aliidiomarina haloalkalitolerans]|uniref:RNase adapter RapZ n=1 Tax=Aliidiomarina haloalkalitolerans TaxID=859059 RepID=A0A432VSS6_9GAMM|nr:RNase adapter RapZ [Aliidiomarina haloalkalitolerans]MCL4410337.1 RNase adapter RapZ [Gammaproteobacteria bacterium]RUO19446.1 RNase adapter RapZ [Aliidiomarina haloalkalitolerans]
MQLIVVSGRSGSGKTVALRALEDLGFYCVDNLPMALLPTLLHSVFGRFENIAVSIDVRNLEADVKDLNETLEFLPHDVKAEVLFIDASDETLIRRYGETRRMHPLSHNQATLADAIATEGQLLEPLAALATWRLDSSELSVHDLIEQVNERVLGRSENQMILVLMSFGFKHGLPTTADTVFDARILPNPHWEPELRPYSGLDAPVQNFLQQQPLVSKFIHQTETFISTWLPYFQRSNRSYLTVAIGCTGGQHRSVYITETLAALLQNQHAKIRVKHRELERKKNQ